jgi:aspartyl-tRNA(Asn)/glutamyl-tRNA(Gln) amidotransferase subunit A
VQAAVDRLGEAGLRLRPVTIPELSFSVATQLVTIRAEASANHLRWIRRRPRSYGRDVRIRLQLGAMVTAREYLLAQRAREILREAMRRAFEKVDVLALPSVPIVAPRIGERTVAWRGGREPVDGALVRLTSPFNLTGVPALSVPCGYSRGLPVGLQLVAPWAEEERLLGVGRLVEENAGP